jgi:hypothetical protein
VQQAEVEGIGVAAEQEALVGQQMLVVVTEAWGRMHVAVCDIVAAAAAAVVTGCLLPEM